MPITATTITATSIATTSATTTSVTSVSVTSVPITARVRARAPRFGFFLVLFACLWSLAGCGKKDAGERQSAEQQPATISQQVKDQQARHTEKPKVALIMKSLANEFFVRMAEGARRHQSANTDQYELVINGIKDESDLTQQVALVEQMVASGADVIVIAPADSKALVPAIKRAAKAGVKVINIDNKLDPDILRAAGLEVPFVGPDNREGARLVGEYLAQTLGAGAKVAIIGGIPTAFNAQQRQRGFEDAMSAAAIEIVSIQNGDWQQAKASAIAAALITEYPNLKAILCSNDNMAIGAAAAIKKAGKEGSIQVVGFDNIAATHELLKNGRMLATAEQYGNQLAVFGIEYALQILNGGDAPQDKKTPVELITAASLQP